MRPEKLNLGKVKSGVQRLKFHKVDLDVFDILNLKQMEIRHSRMVAFLLNPNAEHKSDMFLYGLYRYLGFTNKRIKKDFISVDCETVSNMDIFIRDSYNKIIIVIENKINSREHSNQLEKYYKYTKANYTMYNCKYIYLCKNMGENIDERWSKVSYEILFDDILFKNKIKGMDSSMEKFIENYKYTFIREFNMSTRDNEKKKALEFYTKYKDTLDIVYQFAEKEGLLKTPAYVQLIKEELEELDCTDGRIEYEPSLKNGDIAFFSKQLNNYFRPAPKGTRWGAWGKGVAYFYWFQSINDGADCELVFELGGINRKDSNNGLSNNKKLYSKIETAFKKARDTFKKKKPKGLVAKKGSTKKEIGGYNQMYSYKIKNFNDMSPKQFKEAVRKAIYTMMNFEDEWYKQLRK